LANTLTHNSATTRTYISYPIFSPAVNRYIFTNQAGPGGLDGER